MKTVLLGSRPKNGNHAKFKATSKTKSPLDQMNCTGNEQIPNLTFFWLRPLLCTAQKRSQENKWVFQHPKRPIRPESMDITASKRATSTMNIFFQLAGLVIRSSPLLDHQGFFFGSGETMMSSRLFLQRLFFYHKTHACCSGFSFTTTPMPAGFLTI